MAGSLNGNKVHEITSRARQRQHLSRPRSSNPHELRAIDINNTREKVVPPCEVNRHGGWYRYPAIKCFLYVHVRGDRCLGLPVCNSEYPAYPLLHFERLCRVHMYFNDGVIQICVLGWSNNCLSGVIYQGYYPGSECQSVLCRMRNRESITGVIIGKCECLGKGREIHEVVQWDRTCSPCDCSF